MNRLSSILLLIIIALGFGYAYEIHAQNYQNIRMELQQQQEDAQSAIQTLRNQIIGFQEQVSAATDEHTRNYEQFQNLQRELALRNAVIKTMEEERAAITEELSITADQIRDLNNDLNTIVNNYKSSLSYLYKHGRMPEEVMLLTSTSINQMLVRSYYLRNFEDYRQKQAHQVTAMQEELKLREAELEATRQRNRENIAETIKERQELENARQRQERQVAELQRNRDRLEQRLNATRSEAESLESTLTELIEEESRIRVAEQERLERLELERQRRLASAANIRSSRERETQIARYSTPAEPSVLPSDDQLTELETSFEDLKGSIPWPVSSGVVSAHFGNRVNPVYGTRIDNPGIEIVTDPRSEVRSVHDGYVFAVQPISGFGNCVFVKHGRYITVYGNMSEISVSRNSFVRKEEVIGRSGDENSLRGASLFFMIRDQSTNLDPEIWITAR